MEFSCNARAFLLLRINQSAANGGKSFLGLLALCHVDAGTYITGERTFRTKSRHPRIQDPSILSILPPQAILHFERLTPLEELIVSVQAQLQSSACTPSAHPLPSSETRGRPVKSSQG